MSRTSLFWRGAAAVCLLWAGRPVVAQSIPEIQPSRVLKLAAQRSLEEIPVISRVIINSDGTTLATAGDDHLVRFWDAESGRVLGRLEAHTDWVRAAAFEPGGDRFISAGDDRRIRFWDAPSGTRLQPIGHHVQPVWCLAFRPDGREFAAGGFSDTVRVFDAESGELLRELDAPGRDVRALTYSPDGLHLAAAGQGGAIRVWNAADGSLIGDFTEHVGRVNALAYSADGAYFASAGADGSVRLWDGRTYRAIGAMPAQEAKILSLTFCGSGMLAAGGTDNRIHLWDLAAGRPLYRLTGHTGSVSTMAWNSARGTLISSGFDTTVCFWRLDGLDVTARQGQTASAGAAIPESRLPLAADTTAVE